MIAKRDLFSTYLDRMDVGVLIQMRGLLDGSCTVRLYSRMLGLQFAMATAYCV